MIWIWVQLSHQHYLRERRIELKYQKIEKENKLKVAAVVVTYNRKFLLERCLKFLLMQSRRPDTIIIVENNCTDGTFEYINNVFKEGAAFRWVRLKQNKGGAGGFCAGLKEVLRLSYHYAWLMDDDGYPDPHCLENLIAKSDQLDMLGPVVLDDVEKTLLSFTTRISGTNKILRTLKDFVCIYPDHCRNIIFPFNGTLIPISLIKNIGYPREEYFIWGDEVEYIFRARSYNYTAGTVSCARFYHPRSKLTGVPMFFGLMRFSDGNSDLKRYCFLRNNIRNLLEYKGYIYALAFLFKALWFYTFSVPSLKNIKILYDAAKAAHSKDFTGHLNYLK